MKHADRLMERILVLDGLPNLQDLGKLLVGEDVPEILDCDLRSERGAQAAVKEGIAHCESVRDYVSREILEDILERHRGTHRFTWKPRSICWPSSGGPAELLCSRRWATAS